MGSNFHKHLSNLPAAAAAHRGTLITHDVIVIIAEPCVELTEELNFNTSVNDAQLLPRGKMCVTAVMISV